MEEKQEWRTGKHLLLVGVVAYALFLSYAFGNYTAANDCNIYYDEAYDEYIEAPGFLKMADDIANERDYVIDEWDCSNTSEKLTQTLLENGYNAKYASGYYEEDNGSLIRHAWVIVEVPIEATNGKLIPPEEYGMEYAHVWDYDLEEEIYYEIDGR